MTDNSIKLVELTSSLQTEYDIISYYKEAFSLPYYCNPNTWDSLEECFREYLEENPSSVLLVHKDWSERQLAALGPYFAMLKDWRRDYANFDFSFKPEIA